MRLIDADDLLRQFEEGVWNSAVEEVDNQPTAYDLDAVVRELEDEIRRTKREERKAFLECNSNLGFCLNGKASALKYAVEVVKRGGRND